MKFKILISIIIIIILIIIALSIFFPCFFENLSNITIVVSILTAVIMIHYNEYKKTKIMHDLFLHYNSKYNEIDDYLREVQDKDDKLIIGKNNKIIDYINLCAEEYFWFKKGLISKEIWNNWKNGIDEKLKCNKIKEVFIDECTKSEKTDSYYGYFKKYTISK